MGALLLAILVSALALGGCCGDLRPSAKAPVDAPRVERSPGPVKVNAVDLSSAYAHTLSSPPRHVAWRDYQGKALAVSGEVVRKGERLGSYEVALRGEGDGEVICLVPEGGAGGVDDLHIGQSATLVGVGAGWLGGPVLRDCALAPERR